MPTAARATRSSPTGSTRGTIKGVDCAGVPFAFVVRIPGNILEGNWDLVVYMGDQARPEQKSSSHSGRGWPSPF
jgi:hypothetical protein